MSFDDYANHIIQKYRLAVALAVLKDKPSDLSVEKYIELLRRKVNDKNDNLEETICSDDFQIDDNITCSNITGITEIDTSVLTNITEVVRSAAVSYKSISEQVVTEENKFSQSLLDEYIINNDATNPCKVAQSNNKIHSNKINEIIYNNDVSIAINTNKHPQYRSSINTQCLDNTNQDSVSILQNYVLNNSTQNKTSVKFRDCSTNTNAAKFTNEASNQYARIDSVNNNDSISLIKGKVDSYRNITEGMQNNPKSQTLDHANYNDINEAQLQYIVLVNDNDFIRNADNTQIYDAPINSAVNFLENTQNYTQVSQSQTDNVYVKGILLKAKTKGSNKEEFHKHTNNETNILIKENNAKSNNDFKMINNTTNISINENDKYNNDIDMTAKLDESYYPTQYAQISETEVNNLNISSHETEPQINEQNQKQQYTLKEQNEVVDCNENSKSQAELIPFKVLEELSIVKSYLGRRIEREINNEGSLESGYKSDSQSRSIKNASQLPCNSVNQSAYCLLEYLTNTPLLAASQRITTEVSMALSKLIDKLHEEEKYLAFLDKLLEIVDELLQNLFESDNCEDNVLLRKDEEIERLLLLNQSRHIQAYSIERLSGIVEKIHDRISLRDEMYEVENIDQVENTCYVLYVLQSLLERYTKQKIEPTPTDSQNELKKSSITDIWKRKWDPKFKEQPKTEGTLKTKCVLVKCSEVLNKLVVTSIDGYSLVSYAALQCFNVLQN
ncbi:hypothetical protein ACJJTC_015234 [Scirpophaga incertulas]